MSPEKSPLEPGVVLFEPLGDGGIAHYTFNLFRGLESCGQRPCLYTSARYEFQDEYWRPGSLETRLFRLAFSLIAIFPALDRETKGASLIRRLIKLLEYPFNALEFALWARRKRVPIAHLQTVNFADLLVILACRLAGVSLITTIHNVNPLHRPLKPFHVPIYKAMYGLSNRLIIHTEAGKGDVVRLFGIDPSKISVIPHGDYSFFVPEKFVSPSEARLNLSLDHQGPVLLFFGAIRHSKGLHILLKALDRIRNTRPDCLLLIAGEPGDDYSTYRGIIEELGLESFVREDLHYISIEAVPNYFLAADIAVLPYLDITQSGVLQVAMAFGKPVVASDLPGFREIITPGKTGWLSPPGDSYSLADSCITVLEDQESALKIAEAGKDFVTTEFSWERIAHRTEDEVYRELI